MDVAKLLRILWRRSWIIASVVLAAALGFGLRLWTAVPAYEAQVKLQMTVPQLEEIEVYERYRASNARDELTVARNNFNEVLQSRAVMQRVIDQLKLTGADAEYSVDVRPIRDADFNYMTVEARSPQLAAAIANAHVAAALSAYGDMRAKPAAAAREFLATELAAAQDEVRAASAEFTEFQLRNNITTLDGELAIYQSLIDKLQSERNQRLIEGPTSWEIQRIESLIEQLNLERERAAAEQDVGAVQRFDASIAGYQQQLLDLRAATSPTANVDKIIAARRAEVQNLTLLRPRYEQLQEQLLQAGKKRDLLQDKYTEALIKENTIRTAGFIQVVEPAIPPVVSAPTNLKTLMILALVGSLGLGVLAALAYESMLHSVTLFPLVSARAARRNGHHPARTSRSGQTRRLRPRPRILK